MTNHIQKFLWNFHFLPCVFLNNLHKSCRFFITYIFCVQYFRLWVIFLPNVKNRIPPLRAIIVLSSCTLLLFISFPFVCYDKGATFLTFFTRLYLDPHCTPLLVQKTFFCIPLFKSNYLLIEYAKKNVSLDILLT